MKRSLTVVGIATLLATKSGISVARGDREENMARGDVLAVEVKMAFEQRKAQMGFTPYDFSTPLCPVANKGDRLWLWVRTAPHNVVYVLAEHDGYRFRKVAVSRSATERTRVVFPKGLVVSETLAGMRTLYLVASVRQIEVLESFTQADCGAESKGNSLLCDLLLKLYRFAPKQAKGLVPPPTGLLKLPHATLPAVLARHEGRGIVAVMFHFAAKR